MMCFSSNFDISVLTLFITLVAPTVALTQHKRQSQPLGFEGITSTERSEQLRRVITDESANSRLKLHLMKDKGLEHDGAVCLDGSDAGFFYASPKEQGSGQARSWQIVFEGGAWCFHEDECIERADTALGSSKQWRTNYKRRELNGMMSDDCSKNPDFCNFNRVFVPYCDGTSFTGNVDLPREAKKVDGTPITLYYRGKRILDALIDTLLTMGLQEADNVIVSGYSSGGLTVLIHADHIHERLQKRVPNLSKFRAIPLSGFFLDHMSSLTQTRVFGAELANMFKLANSSGAMDEECIKTYGEKEALQCIYAPNALRFVNSHTYLINSGIDEWQIALGGHKKETQQVLDAWFSCFESEGFNGCSKDQIQELVKFHDDFKSILKSALKVNRVKSGDGAFIHSCPTHIDALDDDEWSKLKIQGHSMQEAVHNWWHSDGEHPTSMHILLDCHPSASPPFQCNPTCPRSAFADKPSWKTNCLGMCRRTTQPWDQKCDWDDSEGCSGCSECVQLAKQSSSNNFVAPANKA